MEAANPLARTRADNIRVAVASHSTCSSATAVALQEILAATKKPLPLSENSKLKSAKSVTVTASLQTQAPPRTTPKTKVAVAAAVEVFEETSVPLSSKEKFILATDVVNATLKSLSDALKPQPKGHRRISSTKASTADLTQAASSPRNSCTALSGSSFRSQRSLQEQCSNASKKRLSRRSSSYSASSKPGPQPGIVATGECARVAFAYLRTSEASRLSGKDIPTLQLENGMLALVGKLIAHGLESAALKELRILKKRLGIFIGKEKEEKDKGHSKNNAGSKKVDSQSEKETLPSLLYFDELDLKSPALPLIISHQMYTLRVIGASKRPNVIETVLEYLDLSEKSSPANLISEYANTPRMEAKAARQLDTFAQIILSLCPSISSSEDALACNDKIQPSPEAVFRLQNLAFQVRQRWWKLAGHQGNVGKELFEPFAKCLSAFARRSKLPATRKYKLATDIFRDLELSSQTPSKLKASPHTQQSLSYTSIHRTLSSLAQAASLTDEALRWTESSGSTNSGEARGAKAAAGQIRIAALSLEAHLSQTRKCDVEKIVENALGALRGSLAGDSSDLDSLFTEVVGFRRVAAKIFTGNFQSAQTDAYSSFDTLQCLAFSIISATTHFVARYVCTESSDSTDAKVFIRHGERIAMTMKVIKSMVDSVVLCCKQSITSSTMRWEELDAILQDCYSILLELQGGPDADEAATVKFNRDLQFPLVKISNLYWMYYLHSRKNEEKSENWLKVMKRSAEILLRRSQIEKQSGLLPMKLEKLGEAHHAAGRVGGAREALLQAVDAHLESGALKTATGIASTSPLQHAECDESVIPFARVLKTLHQSYIKYGVEGGGSLAFIDKEEIEIEERGLLLEWQLSLFSTLTSKQRNWDSTLSSSVQTLGKRLMELYTLSEFPLRRQRTAILLLQIAAECSDMQLPEYLSLAAQCETSLEQDVSRDAGLTKYHDHLRATLRVHLAFGEGSPSIGKLKDSLVVWQSIVDAAESWSSLSDRVDDVRSWLLQLETISDYLAAKGEEYLRVSVLTLITKILEFQKCDDPTQLVLSLSKLGHQFLELGYTGKAGLSLAKAQNLLSSSMLSTEAKLQWHLVYAEYLLRIGNIEKCESTLCAAEKVAHDDPCFLSLSKPSTTLSGRVRFNRVIANACYVYSLLALENGNFDGALRYAKRCVTLNRRVWATLENRTSTKRVSRPDSGDSEMEGLTEGSANSTSSVREVPVVMSITHDSLNGAAFWSFIPFLYRGLSQQSQVFAHQGMFQEAVYFAEQADKVAAAVSSRSLRIDNLGRRADYWTQGGRADKAQDLLDSVKPSYSDKNVALARYHCSAASVFHANGEFEKETDAYERAETLLHDLSIPSFIQQLDKIGSAEDVLVNEISAMKLDANTTKKQPKTTRGRKPIAKAPARTARKVAPPKSQITTTSTADECFRLSGLQGDVLCRKAMAMLLQDKLSAAAELLERAESLQNGHQGSILQQSSNFKRWLAQSMKEMSADFTYNVLLESSISFPALARTERKFSEGSSSRPECLSPAHRASLLTTSPVKSGRGKKSAKDDFAATLRRARECIGEVYAVAIRTGSNSVVRQICRALGYVTVLLSATHATNTKVPLHPLYTAYLNEIPKQHASLLEQSAIEIEKESTSRDDLLKWPDLHPRESPIQLSASQFQNEYVEIIPETWTAISLSLNEEHDELYITRYHAGQSPFILRLPMARHKSRDMDEDVFGFEDGKSELMEIIELSNFSTHDARDMNAKGAKTEWWAEREALDNRLRDLLVNIENIWLGGFRGIFSQHVRQPNLLARFQKSFQNILNRHLPSRQGRGQQKKINLEPRILELFIGLGDAMNEELDLDEPLMDLMYFVVDILQFSGERNAYDEIDFDSIVVETLDALRAYHSASQNISTKPTHTILILDKDLHAFPWESLPCLQPLSISRLPSLAALRERLVTARPPLHVTDKNAESGHHISASAGGTSILNPSGDLTHTQRTLRPHLDAMEGDWTHIIAHGPSEKEFEAALHEKDLLLYFGHGSGAQYIRSRVVKKLHERVPLPSSPSSAEEPTSSVPPERKPSCATSFLFGCSSALVAEHGVFEPSGMLMAYLAAGAPAVVGMLWDVTDKDCDRFAVRAGEIWGLWPETPASDGGKAGKGEKGERGKGKGKGKGRVLARVAEVESARGAGVSRGGRKGEGAFEAAGGGALGERRRGVGLDEAVRGAREACVLKHLNGAAAVVYGIPVFLD